MLPPYPDIIVLASRKSTVHRFGPDRESVAAQAGYTQNRNRPAAALPIAPIDPRHQCVRRNILEDHVRIGCGTGAATRWHTTLVLEFGVS
jgi:hypothetical protein